MISPSCVFFRRNFSIILDRRCHEIYLPRAATKTASSDGLPSVSPGSILSLTETDDPDHLGLFSMPDMDRQLGAQESLPTKTAVEPYPPVPVNQQKTSVICSSILGDIPNQLLQRILQSIFRPIFSITVNSPLPLTSRKI